MKREIAAIAKSYSMDAEEVKKSVGEDSEFLRTLSAQGRRLSILHPRQSRLSLSLLKTARRKRRSNLLSLYRKQDIKKLRKHFECCRSFSLC